MMKESVLSLASVTLLRSDFVPSNSIGDLSLVNVLATLQSLTVSLKIWSS